MFRGAIDHFYMRYKGDVNRKHGIQVLLFWNKEYFESHFVGMTKQD